VQGRFKGPQGGVEILEGADSVFRSQDPGRGIGNLSSRVEKTGQDFPVDLRFQHWNAHAEYQGDIITCWEFGIFMETDQAFGNIENHIKQVQDVGSDQPAQGDTRIFGKESDADAH